MWGVLAIVIMLLIIYILYDKKEHLTGQDVYNRCNGKLDPKYEDFKQKVPEAHIVNYYDFKKLDKEGRFTPDNIQSVL